MSACSMHLTTRCLTAPDSKPDAASSLKYLSYYSLITFCHHTDNR
jgi:hypothetical protein